MSEWFKVRKSFSKRDNFQTSAHKRYTSSLVGASEAGSSTSSRSSLMRREAIIKLKLAKLEAQQTKERTKEDYLRTQREIQKDSLRAQREVERKVQRATLELKLWDEEVNRTSDENIRYDITKPVKVHHTNQQSGSALVQDSEQAENHFNHTFRKFDQSLPISFTSTSAPATASRVRFDKNVYHNIPSSNGPTPLYDVYNTRLSSTYVSSTVINNALSQSGYRPPASFQPHGMPEDYYSVIFLGLSFPFLIYKCASHTLSSHLVFFMRTICFCYGQNL